MQGRQRGFTIIEIMIAVAIVGILAAIAYPNYADYVIRGKLADATTQLSSVRSQLEQFYQDNRTYVTTGVFKSPCDSTLLPKVKDFTFSCIGPTATTYTVVATGVNSLAGFNYRLDQLNAPTSDVGSRWGGSTGNACWILKKGSTC